MYPDDGCKKSTQNTIKLVELIRKFWTILVTKHSRTHKTRSFDFNRVSHNGELYEVCYSKKPHQNAQHYQVVRWYPSWSSALVHWNMARSKTCMKHKTSLAYVNPFTQLFLWVSATDFTDPRFKCSIMTWFWTLSQIPCKGEFKMDMSGASKAIT